MIPKVLTNANIISILYHLPSDYYVLDSILSTLHTQSHRILKQLNEEASITFHSHIKNEETSAQRRNLPSQLADGKDVT